MKPMDVQFHCVIYKKASVEEEFFFFPYKRLQSSTRSISQGTEVTIVTEVRFMSPEQHDSDVVELNESTI